MWPRMIFRFGCSLKMPLSTIRRPAVAVSTVKPQPADRMDEYFSAYSL